MRARGDHILGKKFEVTFVSITLCVVLAASLFTQAEAANIQQVDTRYLTPRDAIARIDQLPYVISLDPASPIHITGFFLAGHDLEIQRLRNDPMFGTANSDIEYIMTMREAPTILRVNLFR